MENSVKKKWFVWGLKFFSWTMFKWWLILTNFPAQPPKASFDRRRRSSKTTLQSQNTTTNQINPRWTKTKVIDFQVLRVDLDKWTEESKKAAALSRFFAVTFSLVARRLQFLSRRWTCVSWWGRQMERGVGTRAGRGGGFVRRLLLQAKLFNSQLKPLDTN